jgi:hypothetical protein
MRTLLLAAVMLLIDPPWDALLVYLMLPGD